MKKKVFAIILVALLVIQFFRPEKNIAIEDKPNSALEAIAPDSVRQVLQVACFDCHSNNTNYPWYAEIMPVGWWLAHHVNEGKRDFNFSAIEKYNNKRLAHKLEETIEMVESGEMPLTSYTLMHPEAKLTDEQARLIVEWAKREKRRLEQQ
ncbi:MAG TPA: heme-binding domain-containing protein [Cytophagaceae bacterium]